MKILDSNTGVVTFGKCPNGCVDGFLFDPYTKRKMPCAACAGKREEYVRGGKDADTGETVYELLNIPRLLTGASYDQDSVIIDKDRNYMDSEGMRAVLGVLSDLVNMAAAGRVPEESLLFNLGSKASELNFIVPYMLKAYAAGLKVAPYVSLPELCNIRMNYEAGVAGEHRYRFTDFIDADLFVATVDAGATMASVMALKGVMQIRAVKMRPTIIFTHIWKSFERELVSLGDYVGYSLATVHSIFYGGEASKKQKGGGKSVTNEEFRALTSPRSRY